MSAVLLGTYTLQGQDKTDSTVIQKDFQFTFITPLGTNGTNAPKCVNKLSLNLLAGIAYGVDGIELGGFMNVVRRDVKGIQLAGFANSVFANVKGIQGAGYFNYAGGNLLGVQASGFTNVNLGKTTGGQFAGFVNYNGDSLYGAQLSGFANCNVGDLKGAQLAGFANYNHRSFYGLQGSGFVNVNRGNMKGAQLAGFGNLCFGDMEGMQVSGFMNVAKKVKGAQIGLLNVADSVDGVLYAGYYYPRARAGRIVEYLNKEKKWKPADMKAINLDVVSISTPEVAKEMASVLSSLNKPEFSAMIDLLQNWNGDHKQTDTAPSVYYNLLSQIYYGSMKDEIGAAALSSILATSVPKNSVNRFIKNESSPWWDDVTTKDVKETRSAIFEKAARKSLVLLKETCGEKPEDWVWGKIHTLKHDHPLGAVALLDKFFSVGPFSVDGGNEVLNNLHFELDTTGYFPVNGGPALRKITDFSNIENSETVSPTGQSGNVMSPFYADQAEMFATGKFRKMLMNRAEIEKVSANRLVLKPR